MAEVEPVLAQHFTDENGGLVGEHERGRMKGMEDLEGKEGGGNFAR